VITGEYSPRQSWGSNSKYIFFSIVGSEETGPDTAKQAELQPLEDEKVQDKG
jgi:hypothetical protein